MTGINDCENIVLKCPKCGGDMFFLHESGDPSVGMYGDYASWSCGECEYDIELADIQWKCSRCDKINNGYDDFCSNHPIPEEWGDYEEGQRMMARYEEILCEVTIEYCTNNLIGKNEKASCICGEHVTDVRKIRNMTSYEKNKIYPLAMKRFEQERDV